MRIAFDHRLRRFQEPEKTRRLSRWHLLRHSGSGYYNLGDPPVKHLSVFFRLNRRRSLASSASLPTPGAATGATAMGPVVYASPETAKAWSSTSETGG